MVSWSQQSRQLKRISIGSAVFPGLTSVTDRPTDRPCYSVSNKRPHVRMQYCDVA